MASIIIRNLPDRIKQILRINAAILGLSLESYARSILENASKHSYTNVNILDLADKYFGIARGVDLDLPSRNSKRMVDLGK